MTVKLRKFPYPFRGAIAICNDCDLMTRESFQKIHAFLNTAESTEFGDGLGLDIADSVFWYNNNPYEPDQLAYAGLDGKPTRDAGFIRECIEKGRIDCLHAYGDFSHRGGFARKHAETAAEEMEKRGISFRVWLNHGDRHNFQNIAAEYLPSLGDTPEVVMTDGKTYPVWEYHTDITTALGVRYFWNHTLTEILGQDRPLSRTAYYRELAAGSGSGGGLFAALVDKAGSLFPRGSFMSRAAKLTVENSGVPVFGGNDLLIPHVLGDGRPVCRFRRWGHWRTDTSEALGEMLSGENLDTLIRREGYAITYAHFGKRREPAGPLLPDSLVESLKRLKGESENRIWVARTSRLLEYNRAWRAVGGSSVFRAGGKTGDAIHLVYDAGGDPLAGTSPQDETKAAAGLPPVEELAGLTWYFDGDYPPRVIHGDRDADFRENPPDHEGMRSITLTGNYL
ncbi:MAG: hypothetical protein E3J72_09045 [Planctomycetota bacterium]|nr:MAG: hypothetical protein E3J72_09045 [Planctomycetota bacterium]